MVQASVVLNLSAKQCHTKGPEKGTLSITCMEELDGEFVKSRVERVACRGSLRCP